MSTTYYGTLLVALHFFTATTATIHALPFTAPEETRVVLIQFFGSV